MAKDPAFLFYSQDFFLGTATMSFEDKGKYIHIMCLMHQQGRLDEETIRFTVGSVSVKLKNKFKIDENGFWYNSRLEEETKKRNHFTKTRRDNGSKGGRPKKDKTDRLLVGLATGNHSGSHMGNENDNINNTSIYTDTLSNSIVTEMIKIFKTRNPNYPITPKDHYPQCLQIAYRIAQMKGWEQKDVLNGKMQETLKSWTKIVDFIKTDDWMSTRGLIDLNNTKEWDRLIQKMNNAKNPTKKIESELKSPIRKESETDFEKYKKKV